MADKARARASDPETSHEAADSVADIRASQFKVMMVLMRFPEGATDEELIRECSNTGLMMSDSGIRSRRAELVKRGVVEHTGEYSVTNSGRKTRIWKVTDDNL